MTRSVTRLLLCASAVALISVAACSKKAEDAGVTQQPDANPAATVPTPANEAAAPDFVAKAAASDMFEISAANLAKTKATSPEVKKFAADMIAAHTKSTADLKAAIASSGAALALPAALPNDLSEKIDDFSKTDAKDFDRKYMDNQVDAHQAALDLMQRYANDGDNPAIKAFAAATAPVVQTHYDHAKMLRDSLK